MRFFRLCQTGSLAKGAIRPESAKFAAEFGPPLTPRASVLPAPKAISYQFWLFVLTERLKPWLRP